MMATELPIHLAATFSHTHLPTKKALHGGTGYGLLLLVFKFYATFPASRALPVSQIPPTEADGYAYSVLLAELIT